MGEKKGGGRCLVERGGRRKLNNEKGRVDPAAGACGRCADPTPVKLVDWIPPSPPYSCISKQIVRLVAHLHIEIR